MTLNIFSQMNYSVSHKTLQNQMLGQKLVSKAQQLVENLERINTSPMRTLPSPENNLKLAEDKLDELIAGSIKEIIEIRKSLGITEAAGQNKPLDELFKTIKGSVFSEEL